MPGENEDNVSQAPASETTGVERPTFHSQVLIISLVVAAAVLATVALISGILNGHVGLSAPDWKSLTPSSKLAAHLVLPLCLLGAVLVAVGAAMAVTEWAGTFATGQDTDGVQKKGLDGVDKVIDSVGKLRGPALLIVGGAILLLGSAWVASSAAEPPTTSGSSASVRAVVQ